MGLFDDIIGGIEQGIDKATNVVTNTAQSAIDTVESAGEDLYHTIFGGGSSSAVGEMNSRGDVSLTDIRWDGMSNGQLASVVQQMSQGPGATAMQQAADALAQIAVDLQTIDTTLHQQLQAIGVNWQSDASDLAQQMTTTAAAYGGTASDTGTAASGGVSQTGETFSTAKHGVPTPNTLNGPTTNSVGDNLVHTLTLTAVTTDHAQQVAQTNAARTQAIDHLTNYASGAQTAISSYTAPPVPPGVSLTTSAVDTSLGQMAAVQGPTGGIPAVSGGSPGSAGGPISGVAPGAGPGFTGLPPVGGAPGVTPPPVSGGGGNPVMPGPISGIGPNAPAPGTLGGTASNVESAAVSNFAAAAEDAGVAAVVAGGATAAAVGAGSDNQRSGRPVSADKGVFSEDPEFKDVPGVGGEPAPPAEAPKALVSPDEAVGAAEANAAERFTSTAERAEPTFMQPATGGSPGEDDKTHSSKYVQGEDVFGDARLVTPSVLGDDRTEPPAGAPDNSADGSADSSETLGPDDSGE
ncbi:MAG TPA: WXG100 family type VII secretion target [Pseudonocardiaceae bacterium]|jgi:hypothetical protein|nr:WXG100 family type VII secretion target [Pseudonocardiaceae bacterium]